MEAESTLTLITICGVTASFVGTAVSHVWKSSVDIDGRIAKRLTPFGWLSLGVALIGLSSSVASELIRVNIRTTTEAQQKAEAAQKKLSEEQEAQWRAVTAELLTNANKEIEANLGKTISGFQAEQETSLRNMHEIILAGQPLLSLSFNLSFSSEDAALWKAMRQGQDDVRKNAEDEQGGVPEVPYEAEDYGAMLLPMLSFIAHVGSESAAAKQYETNKSLATSSNSTPVNWLESSKNSIVVLMPLDDSDNTVLSFGQIGPNSVWWDKEGDDALSSGFLTGRGFKTGNSWPTVGLAPAGKSPGGVSRYSVGWTLDPVTLSTAIQKTNKAITPTARLPRVLKLVILYDVVDLPFRKNDFGTTYAVNLWSDNAYARTAVPHGSEFENAKLTVEVNGFLEKKYDYVLKDLYRLSLSQEDDDPFDTGCTVLEFESA